MWRGLTISHGSYSHASPCSVRFPVQGNVSLQFPVVAQGGFSGLCDLRQYADFIFRAILQQLLHVLLKYRLGMYHVVAQQIVRRNVQGIGYADQGGEAQLGMTAFDIADVGDGQIRQFRQLFLGDMRPDC